MKGPVSHMISRQLLRTAPGAVFGAGLASLAQAATASAAPAFGPPSIIAFGFDVPVLPALFGLVGVVLARRVAPPSAVDARLGRDGRAALTVLLACGVLAIIIAGQRQPLVALGWSAGLGYSGMAVIEVLAAAVMGTVRFVVDAFSHTIEAMATAWSKRKGE